MEQLDSELERCRKWIEDALDRGGNTHDFEDIAESVKSGFMQLWPADDACAVTEILTFPRKKVLHIFLAAGNMDTIVDMHESAAHFARLNGCSDMTIAGRKGWVRVLKDKGYKEFFTTLKVEL